MEEARQMYQQYTAQYGALKAVKPGIGNRVELVFENGTVDRPPMLTYGYRGTGVEYLKAFLAEAGVPHDALAGIDEAGWEGITLP